MKQFSIWDRHDATYRFQIVNREGVPFAFSNSLADALEVARAIKFYNELTGPSDLFVIDTEGLVQPINIP